MDLSYQNIQNIFEAKGYKFFDNNLPFNINIFGIRMEVDTNKFDDFVGIAFRDGDLEEIVYVWPATTDPGKYWLNHPMNTDGTFILVPGQYEGFWALGLHRGKPAFVQIGKAKGYRDDDKDSEHDMDPETIVEGKFGINGHKSNPYSESYYIDKWSAGCQAWKKAEDHDEALEIAEKSSDIYGNKFTYTLLEVTDFE